jgi:ABC-type dipeptide/oligopeptide/nickel transport system ATPase component
MAAGRLVEEGAARQIVSTPEHAETRKLLAAATRPLTATGAAQ